MGMLQLAQEIRKQNLAMHDSTSGEIPLVVEEPKKGHVGLAERFLIQTETRNLSAPSRI